MSLTFKYSCVHFPSITFPIPPTSHSQSYHPLDLSMGPHTYSLMTLSLLSPIISLCPPLWLLSVCYLFQCIWLYLVVAWLFVLLIKIHLQVRSYGICFTTCLISLHILSLWAICFSVIVFQNIYILLFFNFNILCRLF